MVYTCYIAVGSNLGNRRGNIMKSIEKINALKDTNIIKVSKLIETKPVGGPPKQRNFLNGVIKLSTKLSAFTLLKELIKIEINLGRVRTVRNGPRMIDLDILFFGNKIINSKALTVPHPRMFERDFVIKPLLEVI